jgi:hypothetical protein
MMAFYIWKNPATAMCVSGMFVVLGGSLMYTVVKMREGARKVNPGDMEGARKLNPGDMTIGKAPRQARDQWLSSTGFVL